MKVDIDISGHFNQSELDTMLAMGGAFNCVLVITRQEKLTMWDMVEKAERKRAAGRGKKKKRDSGSIQARLYAIMCYYLIMECEKPITDIVIDYDIPGHEAGIKSDVINWLSNAGVNTRNFYISFDYVGKGPADILAREVKSGKRKPDKFLTAKDFAKRY